MAVLDESKAMRAGDTYTGAALPVRALAGAEIARILHPPGQSVEAHRHLWPVLALYRVGAYREESGDGGAVVLDGPSVVFHPAGALHADEIGAAGLETLSMSFDPAWLGARARAALPTRSRWLAGGAAGGARALAAIWLSREASEAAVNAATADFVATALSAPAQQRAAPPWLARFSAALESEAKTKVLAAEFSLHPAWLARVYRAHRGEGIADTVRRRRVERATIMLRHGEEGLAQIAAAAGFCDQSHMNRCFRAVLGRTPLEVRGEAKFLAAIGA